MKDQEGEERTRKMGARGGQSEKEGGAKRGKKRRRGGIYECGAMLVRTNARWRAAGAGRRPEGGGEGERKGTSPRSRMLWVTPFRICRQVRKEKGEGEKKRKKREGTGVEFVRLQDVIPLYTQFPKEIAHEDDVGRSREKKKKRGGEKNICLAYRFVQGKKKGNKSKKNLPPPVWAAHGGGGGERGKRRKKTKKITSRRSG